MTRQSELKAKLEAKKAAETDPEMAWTIDVNRELKTSDLSISDCNVSIEVLLPKQWDALFQQRATQKRVTKSLTEIAEATDNGSDGGGSSDNGQQTGGNTGGVLQLVVTTMGVKTLIQRVNGGRGNCLFLSKSAPTNRRERR